METMYKNNGYKNETYPVKKIPSGEGRYTFFKSEDLHFDFRLWKETVNGLKRKGNFYKRFSAILPKPL